MVDKKVSQLYFVSTTNRASDVILNNSFGNRKYLTGYFMVVYSTIIISLR